MARTRDSIRRDKLSSFLSQENINRFRQQHAAEVEEQAKRVQEQEEQRRRDEEARRMFENVQGGSVSTEAPRSLDAVTEVAAPTNAWSAIGQSISAARSNVALDKEAEELIILQDLDSPEKREAYRLRLLEDNSPDSFGTREDAQQAQAELLKGLSLLRKAEDMSKIPGEFQRKLASVAARKQQIGARSGAAEGYLDSTGNWQAQAVADTFGQFEQVGSLVGGLVGSAVGQPLAGAAIGAIPQYNVARRAALVDSALAGVPLETAQAYSKAMAASEFVIEAAAGKLAGRFGLDDVTKKVLEKIAATNVRRAAIRTVGAGVISGAEETGTSLLQNIAQQSYNEVVLGDNPDDPFSKYLKGQVPRNLDGSLDVDAYLADLKRVAAAGALGGTVVSTPANAIRARQENQQLLRDAEGANGNGKFSQPAALDAPRSTAIDTTNQPSLFDTPEGLPSVEEYQAQRRQEQEKEATTNIAWQRRNQEVPNNAGARYDQGWAQELRDRVDVARQEVEGYQDRIESGQADSATLNSAAQAQSRLRAAERELLRFEQQPTAAPQQAPVARPAAPQTAPVQPDMFPQVAAPVETKPKRGRKPKTTQVPVAPANTQAAKINPTVLEESVDDAPKHDPKEVLGKLMAERQARNQGLAMEDTDTPLEANDPNNEVGDPDVLNPVFDLLRRKINTREGATILRLMAQGKVKIVEDLPNNQRGYYDGDTTYISARKVLEYGGAMPVVVDVATHEVKHGVDVAGSKLSLGKAANDNIINGLQIAAKNGDQDAIRNWALATGQSTQDLSKVDLTAPKDATARLELAARGINYANQKAQQRGALESVGRTTLSAIRTNWKKATGTTANVNMEDLSYLASRMLTDVALKDVNIQGDVAAATGQGGLAMTISGGRTAATQLQAGRTWLSVDGKRKYEISDKGSSVQIPSDYVGKRFPITDVLKHDALYEELPEVTNATISFEPLGEGIGASFNKDEKHITVNTDDPAFKTGGRNKYDGLIHRYIIHEMQHVAQGVSGTTNGASPRDFLPSEAKALENEIDNIQYAIEYTETMDPDNQQGRILRNDLTKKEQEYQDKYGVGTPIYEEAVDKYERVLGEFEARRTQSAIPFTEDELDLSGRGQQERRWAQEPGGITTPKGKKISGGLAMADDANAPKPAARKDDTSLKARTGRALRRTLAPYGFTDDTLRIIGSFGKGEASALSYEAEYRAKTLAREVNRAVSNTNTKTPRKDVLNAINEAVESTNAIASSETARARALRTALKKKGFHNDLADALINVREYKWDMALRLVNLRMQDPKLMTDKEVNIYNKIMRDAETWTTRAYLSDLDSGYAKRFLAKAKKDYTSEEGQKLERGIFWLANNSLMIPDRTELDRTPLGNLERMLQNWDTKEAKNLKNIKDRAERREAMIDRLEEIQSKGFDYVREKALTIIEDMLLNKGTGTFVGATTRGMKQNRTVLEARAALAPELRDVLGEVTDPYLREVISLARLTGLVGQTEALTQLATEGKDKYYSSVQEGEFKYLLEGSSFGPMAGMYVNKETQDFLGAYVATLDTYDTTMQEMLNNPGGLLKVALGSTVPVVSKLASLGKFMGVVGNLSQFVINLAGSTSFVVSNAVNPKHYWPAFRTAMDISRGNVGRIPDPVRRAAAQEALRAGAVDSAAVEELRGGTWGLVREEVDKAMGKGYKMPIHMLSTVKNAWAEVYAAMDVWTKVATYMQEKDFLTEYNRLENKGWTERDILQRAGLRANKTNVSYAAAIPAVRALERNIPFAFVFATYKSEVVRSTAMSAAVINQDVQYAKEATTPEARALASQRAATRFFGTLTAVVGPIAATLEHLAGLGEEEEEERLAFAEWDQNRVHIPVGKDDDGRIHTMNLNRIDPRGPINDGVIDVVRAYQESPEKGLDALGKASIELLVGNFGRFQGATTLANDVLAAAFDGTFRDKKHPKTLITGTKADQLIKDYADLGVDLGANLTRVLQDVGVPAFITVGMDEEVLNISSGNKEAAKVMKSLGYKGSVQDPDKMLQNAGWTYYREMEKLQSQKKKLFEKELLGDTDKLDKVTELVEKERELFTDLSKRVRVYSKFDAPEWSLGRRSEKGDKRSFEGAVEILTSAQAGKVPNKVLSQIDSGDFSSRLLTEKDLDNYGKKLIEKVKKNSPTYNEEVEDIEARIEVLKEAYADITGGQ